MHFKVLAILLIIISGLSLNVLGQNMEGNSQINSKVLILHGYGASSNDHWFQWLKEELRMRNFEASIVEFPNSSNPDPAEWLKTLDEEIKNYDKNVYIIAHSLGCVTVLQHLQKGRVENNDIELGGLILVSGFLEPLPKLPELNTFLTPEIKTDSLQKITESVVVIGAKNDPIVPYDHIENLAHRLNAKMIELETGGHFLKSDGYREFPKVLSEVEKITTKN
ncbi:alpha/beta fold hydrolase [Gracilimonas sp.]|uniref:RBBP9/YdeN family alpha/beta hydrolase n=1 Tax=Gracilimonas sp. TaxID=1974203 RepID=UPI0032EC2ED0